MLENTIFHIRAIPILLYCQNCENEYAAEIDDLVCPGCQNADFLVVQGKEMLVKSITGTHQYDEE